MCGASVVAAPRSRRSSPSHPLGADRTNAAYYGLLHAEVLRGDPMRGRFPPRCGTAGEPNSVLRTVIDERRGPRHGMSGISAKLLGSVESVISPLTATIRSHRCQVVSAAALNAARVCGIPSRAASFIMSSTLTALASSTPRPSA
jgi:hypothetical protein